MPVSNCTGDDIAYIIDDPPPGANTAFLLMAAGTFTLALAAFLCRPILIVVGLPLLVGGFLLYRRSVKFVRGKGTPLREALERGLVKKESLERARNPRGKLGQLEGDGPSEDAPSLGPKSACSNCTLLGAGKVTNGPAQFAAGSTVTLCNAAGTEVLAKVEIGQLQGSKVQCDIVHFPDKPPLTQHLSPKVDWPLGLVSLHDDLETGGLLVELLPVQ